MESEKYNGWSNYETWLVNLWLNNDQGYYNKACDIIKNKPTDALKLEEWLKFSLLIDSQCEKGSLTQDLLLASLERANYNEITLNWGAI